MTRVRIPILMALFCIIPSFVLAQHAHSTAGKTPPKVTDAEKIKNAMSAAPATIAQHATIMDWPATPNGQMRQLRAGTNGWVCYPSSPEEFGGASVDDPMCLD